jgi:phosphoribosylamine--glycine ligase
MLSAGGYCGYINLNTIVNARGIWPLEFTCRFGYPGFAVLGPLQETRWGDLFETMIKRRGSVKMLSGFCACIVLTTPPFPYDRKTVDEPVGFPVIFDGAFKEQERESLITVKSDCRMINSSRPGNMVGQWSQPRYPTA